MATPDQASSVTMPASNGAAWRLSPALWFAGATLLAFLLLYTTDYIFLPTQTARIIAFLWVAALFFAGLNDGWRVRIDPPYAVALGLFCLTLVWIAFRTAVTGAAGYAYFEMLVRTLIQSIPAAVLLVMVVRWRRGNFNTLIEILNTAIILQAIAIILYFISPQFESLVDSLISQEATEFSGAAGLFRSRGLTHTASAALAAVQGFGILFTFHLLFSQPSRWREAYLLPAIPLLLLSIMLTGRTGFIVAGFSFFYLLTYVALTFRIPTRILRLGILFPMMIIMFLAAFNWLVVTLLSDLGGIDASELVGRIYDWAFGEFSVTGTPDSWMGYLPDTVQILLREHVFLPETMKTMLLGVPDSWDANRVHTDIGYLRRLFASGLIGLFLVYLALSLPMLAAIRRSGDVKNHLLLAFSFTIMFVLEAKEPMWTRHYISFLALTLAIYFHASPRYPAGPRW